MQITDEQARLIADAVLRQAVRDYMLAIRDQDTDALAELEQFAVSDWGRTLSAPADLVLIFEQLKGAVPKFISYSGQAFETGKDSFRCPVCHADAIVQKGVLFYVPKTRRAVHGFRARCYICGMQYVQVNNDEYV